MTLFQWACATLSGFFLGYPTGFFIGRAIGRLQGIVKQRLPK